MQAWEPAFARRVSDARKYRVQFIHRASINLYVNFREELDAVGKTGVVYSLILASNASAFLLAILATLVFEMVFISSGGR